MNTSFLTGDLDNDDWKAWYRLTPQERWAETEMLWDFYLKVGGSLDPEPDSQSPFDIAEPSGAPPAYGGAGVRVIWRSDV